MEDLFVAVVIQIYVTISLPLYVYGIIKWIQFKHHLLIAKRLPLISALMVITSFVTGMNLLVGYWIQYDIKKTSKLSNVLSTVAPQSVSFFVYGLTALRLFMTIMRNSEYQNNTMCLEDDYELSVTVSTSPTNDTSPHKSLYFHWCAIGISTFSVLGALAMAAFLGRGLGYITVSIWTVMILINLLLVVFILVKKVRDGIGCLREAVIILLAQLFFGIVNIFINDNLKFDGMVSMVAIAIISVAPFFQGLFPLYFGLHYIYKCEGTLNASEWSQKHKDGYKYRSEHHLSEISICVDSPVTHSAIINYSEIDTELEFFKFLKIQSHYLAFKEYLSYCWALENLLFVQKVSIVHFIMINSEFIDIFKQSVRGDVLYTQFKFSKQNYKTYRRKVNLICSEHDVENYKKAIYKIYQEIYKEFIVEDSINQINISASTRRKIAFMLNTNENEKRFETLLDFLHFFDDALKEIYPMLISLYSFTFTQFLKSQAAKQNK